VCVCVCVHDAMTLKSSAHSAPGFGRSLRAAGRGADVAGARESTAPPQVLMPVEACMQCSAQVRRKGSAVSPSAFARAQQDVCQRWLSARTVVLSLVHIASAKSLQPRANRAFLCAGTNSGFHLRWDCSSARDARRLVHTKLGDQVAERKEVAVHLHSHTHKCHTHTRARACTHTPNTETHTRSNSGGGTRK
jgi:hypothetical protein